MVIDNRYYDSLGDAWWDVNGPMGLLFRMNPARYAYFSSRISKCKGMRILDAGCGGGFLAKAFASKGAEVHGLDMSRNSLRTARVHAAEDGIHPHVVTGRVENIPYPSHTFDGVLAADILEHLENAGNGISEFARVLRPQGILLYDTVNRTWWSRAAVTWVLERVLRKMPVHTHDWSLFIRPHELVEMLRSHGLENQEVRGLALKGGIPGFCLRLIKGQDPWVFSIGRDIRISYVGYAIKNR